MNGISEMLAVGTLLWSLGMGVPSGWVEVDKGLCLKAFPGQYYSGKVVSSGGHSAPVYPKCLMKVTP